MDSKYRDRIKEAIEEVEEKQTKIRAKEPKLKPYKVIARKSEVNILNSMQGQIANLIQLGVDSFQSVITDFGGVTEFRG